MGKGRWSGRSTLVPDGWALGSSADEYKVCRYSADQDGNGLPNADEGLDGIRAVGEGSVQLK